MKDFFKFTIYDRYVFKQVLFATVAAILLFTIVWIAPEMLLNTIKGVLAGEYTAKTAIMIILSELPNILSKAFPVGLLLGTLFTFDKLSKDCELTIFRAIGLSVFRIAKPVVVLSLIFTALCFVTYDKFIPYATQKKAILTDSIRNIQYMYIQKDKNRVPVRAIIVSNSYNNAIKGIIVLEFARNIFEDVHGISTIYVADSAIFLNKQLYLADAVKYEISNNGIFDKITNIDSMPLLNEEVTNNLYELMNNSAKSPEEFSNGDMRKYLATLKREELDEEYRTILNKYFQRFFSPFVCIALALMGCILGFSKPREQRLIGFTIAIGFIFAYYITLPFFDLLAEKGVLPPILTSTFPLITFCVAIYAFYKYKDI